MQPTKLTVQMAEVTQLLSVSSSTVRRWLKHDPEFPRPFRMTPEGDLLWSLEALQDFVAAKVAQARAA